MAELVPAQRIALAKTLPPMLQRFLARYPPPAISPNSSDADAANPPPSPPNPFQAQRHPVTGKMQNPVYSLRRQAVLSKLARQYGVHDLLPPTHRSNTERLRKRVEEGLRIRGTGFGQRVKGHWQERTLNSRLEMRRKAMAGMPELVKRWRAASNGRSWTNFPKTSKQALPPSTLSQ